jgi:hypothetical protein
MCYRKAFPIEEDREIVGSVRWRGATERDLRGRDFSESCVQMLPLRGGDLSKKQMDVNDQMEEGTNVG